MGLHDRLQRQGDGGTVVTLTPSNTNGRPEPAAPLTIDPYAELKAKVHHACIAKLGPQLYAAGSDG